MNFNNQLNLIKTLIPEGEVDTRIDCPFCNHTNTLIIRRINSDLFWNCFHASCSAKGKHEGEMTMQQVYETVVTKEKEKEKEKTFVLQKSFVSVFSKDKCRLYLDELKSDYEKYTPEKNPTYNLNDFGIRLEETWNYLKNETEYKRDENGYYSIGLITDPSIAEKVTIEDLIISVNGKDLRTLDIDYQDDKKLANLFSSCKREAADI